MPGKLSFCLAASLVLASAIPVPYSTEQNYGSSLSAVTEAGWSGQQEAAPLLQARAGLTASEEAQTKSFLASFLNKVGVGQAKNKNDAVDAILAKVEEGKAGAKRDVTVTREGEQQQEQEESSSWWQRVRNWFHGEAGQQDGMVQDAASDQQDSERMQEVNLRAAGTAEHGEALLGSGEQQQV